MFIIFAFAEFILYVSNALKRYVFSNSMTNTSHSICIIGVVRVKFISQCQLKEVEKIHEELKDAKVGRRMKSWIYLMWSDSVQLLRKR